MLLEITLPQYELTLPISNMVVKYRPFTVKEEKILLLAQEENGLDGIIVAINQIISNCTFGKYNIDNLTKVDAETLFIQLRNKSKGEIVDVRGICVECDAKTNVQLDYSKIEIKNKDLKTNRLEVFDDLWIDFKYPSIKQSFDIGKHDAIYGIALLLDKVIQGENIKNCDDYTIEEKIEFIESLPNMQLVAFNKFFDNYPSVELSSNFICKDCGHQNTINVSGIESFFL